MSNLNRREGQLLYGKEINIICISVHICRYKYIGIMVNLKQLSVKINLYTETNVPAMQDFWLHFKFI